MHFQIVIISKVKEEDAFLFSLISFCPWVQIFHSSVYPNIKVNFKTECQLTFGTSFSKRESLFLIFFLSYTGTFMLSDTECYEVQWLLRIPHLINFMWYFCLAFSLLDLVYLFWNILSLIYLETWFCFTLMWSVVVLETWTVTGWTENLHLGTASHSQLNIQFEPYVLINVPGKRVNTCNIFNLYHLLIISATWLFKKYILSTMILYSGWQYYFTTVFGVPIDFILEREWPYLSKFLNRYIRALWLFSLLFINVSCLQ